MIKKFGLKELYDVRLKATYPIEIGNRRIETGETVALFDRILISNFQERTTSISATGGYDNRNLVTWLSTDSVDLSFTEGVFSREQLALLSNCKLAHSTTSSLLVTERETVETDENGTFELARPPQNNSIFMYNENWERLEYTKIDSTHFSIGLAYQKVVVDYEWLYQSEVQNMIVGQELTSGYLSLEGKTRVKDDDTGTTHTGIVKVPRLKLMSNLSLRLGEKAGPLVQSLDAVALPIGDRKDKVVMEVIFLDDDIDEDK